MDKKALLAVVLSVAVLILYQYYLAPKPAPVPAKAPVAGQAAPAVPKTAAPAVAPATALSQGTQPAAEHIVTVETDKYVARFSTVGGVPEYWMLKKYKGDTKQTKNQNVVILKPGSSLPPLSLGLVSDFDAAHLNFALVNGTTDLRLDKSHPEGKIVFEYSSGQALIRRTYTFHNDGYEVDLKDEVRGFPNYTITLGPDFGIYSREGGRGVHVGPVLLSGTDTIDVSRKKVEHGTVSYTKDVKWIAQEDKYFCSALVPHSKMDEAIAFQHNGNAAIAFRTKNPSVERFALFAGPKKPSDLAALGSGLQYIVDFGIFSIISRPILWLLKLIHGEVGNYGWSIVLLTLLIRIPFLPLVAKGQKSMKKLQQIQPMMQEIRQKYKKDPQRMQREMMDIYKKHKVNPMGGCLPMLLQIPVFFALYKVLLISIALRGAPFVLWITDLSQKDPYYVLPVIMGVTMFAQQKLTPVSVGVNPAQQKLMLIMPVIFTVMFMNFASGLVLYWMVNNLLSVAQQIYINKKVTV